LIKQSWPLGQRHRRAGFASRWTIWVETRWYAAVADYQRVLNQVFWCRDKLDYFENVVNGGRPKGWPDRGWIRAARADYNLALPFQKKWGAILADIYTFLKTHDILDDMSNPPKVIRFLDSPIDFLRYCERWFARHDSGSPSYKLFRLWYDELNGLFQNFMATEGSGASEKAGLENTYGLLLGWGITLDGYQRMRKWDPNLPEYPLMP
jgi:hypothetical protein